MLARLLWLTIIVLTVPSFARALDCQGATPLPPSLAMTVAAPDVPEAIARFAGAWNGPWIAAEGRPARCSVLVVEEVLANGYARVVYGVGSTESGGGSDPAVFRATGRIADGVLRFRLPLPDRPAFTYRFDGDRLRGTFNDTVRATLARAPDVAALGCQAAAGLVSPPAGIRDRLTAAELLAPAGPGAGPIHNDYFMPIGGAVPAKHALRGTLTVPPFSASVSRLGCPPRRAQVPGFSVAFFTHGEHLVPAVRDIVPGALIIVSPGRVWSEPGDGGLSRASFAFAVVNEVNNGTHNGIATFVFDDARVSALAIQVVQETAPWAKIDSAARVPMTYAPGPIDNEPALRQDFAEELAQQMPMRPWSALGATAALADFDGDAAAEDISANGVVMDGVLYVRGCHTRYGPFPYCREMRHGVFSVTKSLGAAVALLRLAQKYGDSVFDEKLTDYLPAGMAHAGWQDVTFADALDMATGIGDERPVRQPNAPFADENRPKLEGFLGKRTAMEKLEVALSYAKYPWNRGEVLRYNSTQTFVLAWAMEACLKRREGPGAQLWAMVQAEVFRPIGVFHAPKMHTLESDGSRGVPLLGYGLYPTVDDVAKLTVLLQSGGRHGGVQLLSATKLADALYRTSPTVGLPLGGSNRYGAARYHWSFWSVPYRTATGCFFQIPYMTGFGGNLVALLPNGISVFRFADGYDFDVDSMVAAGESLRPFCTPPATAAAVPPPAVPLTSAEIAGSFVGHAYTVGATRLYFAPGGRVFLSGPDDAADIGTWRISPGARLCRRWHMGDGGRERCFAIYWQGSDAWDLDNPERFTRFTVRRAPAAP